MDKFCEECETLKFVTTFLSFISFLGMKKDVKSIIYQLLFYDNVKWVYNFGKDEE